MSGEVLDILSEILYESASSHQEQQKTIEELLSLPSYNSKLVFEHISQKTGHVDLNNLHAYLESHNPAFRLGIPRRQDLEHILL